MCVVARTFPKPHHRPVRAATISFSHWPNCVHRCVLFSFFRMERISSFVLSQFFHISCIHCVWLFFVGFCYFSLLILFTFHIHVDSLCHTMLAHQPHTHKRNGTEHKTNTKPTIHLHSDIHSKAKQRNEFC